jgi:putative flippase GtrA
MASPMLQLSRLLLRHRAMLVFGLIGVSNTVLHSATVMALVEAGIAKPVLANVAGFAVANTFSFFANTMLAFGVRPSWERYGKFALVSLLSLALTIALAALAESRHWHYLAGLLLVLLCGPILTFVLHKTFTFRAPSA